MRTTGWIAVAGFLMASPTFAQIPSTSTTSDAQDQISESQLSDSSTDTQITNEPSGSLSFNAELEQLRQEIAALKALREQVTSENNPPVDSGSSLANEQRRHLLELLTKLATKNLQPKDAPIITEPDTAVPSPTPSPRATKLDSKTSPIGSHPLITDKIVDPFALGRALFRAGDYIGAEQAFRKVKVSDGNRVMLQYLIATCLRKQNRWDQAAKAYRVVAENKDDVELRDLALRQLETIRWRQQTESQLEELRKLRERSNSQNAPVQTARKLTDSR